MKPLAWGAAWGWWRVGWRRLLDHPWDWLRVGLLFWLLSLGLVLVPGIGWLIWLWMWPSLWRGQLLLQARAPRGEPPRARALFAPMAEELSFNRLSTLGLWLLAWGTLIGALGLTLWVMADVSLWVALGWSWAGLFVGLFTLALWVMGEGPGHPGRGLPRQAFWGPHWRPFALLGLLFWVFSWLSWLALGLGWIILFPLMALTLEAAVGEARMDRRME